MQDENPLEQTQVIETDSVDTDNNDIETDNVDTNKEEDEEEVPDIDAKEEMQKAMGGIPCPECGVIFGPEVEIPGLVIPQQLIPCGHSVCSKCIQMWENVYKEKGMPADSKLACPLCNSVITNIAPNYLYCEMVLDIMRAQRTPVQELALLVASYRQHAVLAEELIQRDTNMLEVVVTLRSAAEEQKTRADLFEEEVIKLRTVVEVIRNDGFNPETAGEKIE